MFLGDSITATTCYPQLVTKDLITAGYSNFESVGTILNNQACNATYIQTEGHGGALVTGVVTGGVATDELKGWLSSAKPNVLIMHFGTNDIWNSVSAANILTAYTGVVDAARAIVPNIVIFVAQLIPMNLSNCAACPTRVTTLNGAIPNWAASKTTTVSPIYVVDLWSSINATADTSDGVHPTLAGSQKMSNVMTPAILSKYSF
jgi:lysophospholipase L1-like esterase